jgi:ATP-binding cassette, subfamily C (CFTR/MRP), member 1
VQEADGSEEEAGDGKAAEKVAPSPTAATAPFLRNISLDFKAGELTAVVGRVGSGKTSLVNAILGEMKKTAGDVSVVGSIAYVAQSAWIFNDTLKNNVLFGFPYDEARYRRAIRVSALEPDIAILPSGDATAIGEKGINLSGGQKQRVSIARAVYADADVYIFDDPLSALDSHVGQSVFDDCISRKGVLSRKLRVFITNQLQVLPECDRVVFMERGAQRMVGTYDELMADADFRQLANEVEKAAEDPDVAAAAPAAPGAAAGCDGPSNSMSLSIHEVAQAAEKSRAESRDGAPADHASPAYEATERDLASESRQTAEAEAVGDEGEGEKAGKDDGSKLIQEEERLTGNVLVRAYYRYAVACGGVVEFLIILALFCVSVALSVIVNWWLVYWSENSVGVAGKIDDSRSLGFYLGIYFGMGVLYAVLTFWRSVWYLTAALRASKSLHAAMLESVLRAPTSFFDQTPIGRIISRFSRDVNAVDQLLPQAFSQMLATVLNLLASYAYIATVFPIFLAVGVPVTFLYYLLQRFYNRTSIELKRLDSISKSPIYAGFSETLGGLSTIRAYHKQLQFRNENMERIDVNQRAYFSTIASNRWFSLYLEVFGSVLVFATALFAVLSRSTANPASAAAIGLSLTYALQVTGILGFTIRSITELELQMNSVERMDYYGKRLDQEAPAKLKEGNVLREGQVWPSAGEIDIRDAQMRYRPGLDLVLKGISIKIGAGEKVGIVGRTGSGKSSLMLVFLRLVELAGGSITIDGVNVAELGLDDVRSNITIIPQDPVLFSGTVRFNLDPFGVYSEPQLWDALAKSHLKEFVQEFEGGLDAKVTEYGENLSAGQKQLICLTRALLRKSKVLIMDEASSSLDYETDRLLQESIQANMADATILTIAHRLWTLTKCDKILVMRDGLASEFDSPEALLSNPASELRFLVDAMGEDGAARFKELVDENARAVGRTG